jgi:hypothetical protein
MISNKEIINAFRDSNESTIKTAMQTYGFSYEKIEKNKIIYKSEPNLPEVNIVSVKIENRQNVLSYDFFTLLQRIRPYVFMGKQLTIYIAFPIPSQHETIAYILYKKLWI